jgi:hypothetical protein
MPSLLDLPPELLDAIASNFDVLEARKPLIRSTQFSLVESGPQNRRSDRSSLAALSATCSHLRKRIQPILYHCVYPFNAQVEFARTLNSRPDLGAAVRELYYADGTFESRKGKPFYPSVNEYTLEKVLEKSKPWASSSSTNFNELVARQPEGSSWSGLHENEDGSITENARPRIAVDDRLNTFSRKQRMLENTLLIRILQLVPNLQRLTLWYLLNEGAIFLPEGILQNLQEFRLFSRDPAAPEEQSSIYSLDTRMPGLRRLEYHFVQGFPDEEHSSVTELILSNCMLFQEDFSTIARGFVNLHKLSYTLSVINGIDCASSRGIFEALLPRQDTLTDLTVRINGDIMKGNTFRPGEDFWELPDHIDGRRFDPMCLSKLHKLERLVLDADALEDLLKGGFGAIYDRRLLVKLFPSSLRYAEFLLGSAPLDIIDTIGCWAPVCRQSCTNLRLVSFTYHELIEKDVRYLAEGHKAAGVPCSHKCQRWSTEDTLYVPLRRQIWTP